MQQLLRRDVAPRILVLPLELESCTNLRLDTLNSAIEFNVSHILLSSSDLQIDSERLTSLAREIISNLESGSSFSDLAREYSSAPTSSEGGDIGWRNGDQLPSIFSNQVTSLATGEIAEPIIIGNNAHIVKLNDRRGGETSMIPQKLLRHILLNTTELDDDLVIQQRLNEIRDRILMGEDFGIIASAVSDDPMSASDRGGLGWTSPGYLVPEFESQIANLSENEVTLPFQTRFGWHIAQVLDNRIHDGTNELIELECDDEIRNQKFEDQELRWSTQLRDQAYVQILL
jgi:peptidyl-prolyl cis-trans isomerase SurA